MPSLSCLLFLLPLVAAYRETVPLVAWTSHYSSKLDSLGNRPEPFTEPSQFFDAILNEAELCNYDAVIIADQPGLHATDLRTLRKSSRLSQKLSQAKSSIQIPYLPYPSGSDSLEVFKDVVAKRCGARRVELELGQGGITFLKGERHVVVVSMPSLEDEYSPFGRGETLSHCDEQLHNDISNVVSVFPSHIVIYTSSRSLTKRQAEGEPSESVSRPIEKAAAPFNSTLAKGSLVQRYRFFTPGLITAFLIVFGILVPLLMFGIYALSSIQSPVRMDAPKGPSSEKKHQ